MTWNEWPQVSTLEFQGGTLTVRNDQRNLYLLFNLLGATTFDPEDEFWISFDVNRDGKITPGVDLNYVLDPKSRNLLLDTYLGPDEWRLLNSNPTSSRAEDFDAFLADGSLLVERPAQIERFPHRVWEVAIDLAEIRARAGDTVRFGFRLLSRGNDLLVEQPQGFTRDFSRLVELDTLVPAILLPPGDPEADIGFDENPIEVTQAIQTRDNALPLVSDKATMARVYINLTGTSSNQAVWVYLEGTRGGMSLPGSPRTRLFSIPLTVRRTNLNDTANFMLPDSWIDGTVELRAKVRDSFNTLYTSPSQTVTFTRKETPVVWMVPVNGGSASSPVLPSNAEIQAQQSYMETTFPLADVDFVQRPWEDLGPNISVNNTIAELNEYHSRVVLAWVFGLLLTGDSPFDLPDQIYGMNASGGGLSDPIWCAGNGFVARGFRGTSREGTMAHEINHNLDRDPTGFWGRHAPFGCGAPGPDSMWPYSNDDIQEVGIDTRAGSNTVVLTTFPDFMSYCQSGTPTTKWVSSYRWTNLFNVLPNDGSSLTARTRHAALNGEIQDVLYLSGSVRSDGLGNLRPALAQPGFVSPELRGEYSLQLLNRDREELFRFAFPVSFVDSEGNRRSEVFFQYQLPALQGVDQVRLLRRGELLDSLHLSPNPPEVQVAQPNGGEVWSGRKEIVAWEAGDADRDDLFFDVLYSPDGRGQWITLARQVRDTQLTVNSLNLPGGQSARIRVIASDGLHTTRDDSDRPFAVADKPPAPVILAPNPARRPVAGEVITFEADPNDVENPDLGGDNGIWLVNGQVFGVGRRVEAILPQGEHEIAFVAEDQGGQTGEANFLLEVQPPQLGELQIVRLEPGLIRISWAASLGRGLQVAEDVSGPYETASFQLEQKGDAYVALVETQNRTLFFRLLVGE